ncbi:MAG: hypothetical protein KatS3mg101_0780 [Patescibacteria group bacterium]|nr:MAG: hypothetical protein KatS3mg101_0780 [Patescibacteria group bacterium]
MRLFIGYKYSRVEDKQSLVRDLLQLAEGLESGGHQTFILGRDVQKWEGSVPLWKTFPAIFGNILKSDVFIAYITSNVKSTGLTIEKVLASLLGKKVILVYRNDVQEPKAYTDRITFSDVNNATKQILEKLA